jgi:hypothetical protein
MNYYVIYMNDDVEVRTHGPLTREELLARLTPDTSGNAYYGGMTPCDRFPADLNDIAGKHIVIIKGDVVVPRAVATVTKYELP